MLRIHNGFILFIFNTGLKLSTFTIKHTGSEVGYLQISQNIRKLQECSRANTCINGIQNKFHVNTLYNYDCMNLDM